MRSPSPRLGRSDGKFHSRVSHFGAKSSEYAKPMTTLTASEALAVSEAVRLERRATRLLRKAGLTSNGLMPPKKKTQDNRK